MRVINLGFMQRTNTQAGITAGCCMEEGDVKMTESEQV